MDSFAQSRGPREQVVVRGVEWFKSRSLSTHGIGAALVSFGAVVDSDGKVRTYLLQLVEHHPKLATSLLLFGALVAAYKSPLSTRRKAASATENTQSGQPNGPKDTPGK